MKKPKFFLLIIMLIISFTLTGCFNSAPLPTNTNTEAPVQGEIYLYGEMHGDENILNKELELWGEYYNNNNMRHLFIEYPYYTAEFLNLWMQSDSDDILDEIFNDFVGTSGNTPANIEFYKKIKNKFPETVFHGTDVGHQHDTTGERFLMYLTENNLEDSNQYSLSKEAIEQGKHYYNNHNSIYRENTMAKNFIREFDNLTGEDIMGIYGAAHTGLDALNFSGSAPSMAKQLKEHYGNSILSEDLSSFRFTIKPSRIDTVTINKKEYEASYFEKENLSGFKDYEYREFWRLENSYEDFKDMPKTGDVLPYDNYPMLIETGQVFIIDYTKTDGSTERMYYRSDGNDWEGLKSTDGFAVE